MVMLNMALKLEKESRAKPSPKRERLIRGGEDSEELNESLTPGGH